MRDYTPPRRYQRNERSGCLSEVFLMLVCGGAAYAVYGWTHSAITSAAVVLTICALYVLWAAWSNR